VLFSRNNPDLCRRRLRVEAIWKQQEKQRAEVSVEEPAPVREAAAPLDGVGADDPMVPSSDESWVVRLEQSVNIFLTVIQQRTIHPDPIPHPPPTHPRTQLQNPVAKHLDVLTCYSFPQESVIILLNTVYRDRNYARFFVLETIARVPYFGEGSVLSYACSCGV
jgi:ubiquinol oxidase